MGLDSVELLYTIERYFKISISDKQAEKIYTVLDMVEGVAAQLNILSNDTKFHDDLFAQITTCAQRIYQQDTIIQPNTLLSENILLSNKGKWQDFEKMLGLKIPKPQHPAQNTLLANIFNKKIVSSAYEVEKLTFSHLTTAIGARNYQSLLSITNLKSKYEIYLAVSGITAEMMGIDYYEISLEKSFTDNLGID